MRKVLSIVLALCLILMTVAGCAVDSGSIVPEGTDKENAAMEGDVNDTATTPDIVNNDAVATPGGVIDIDLTLLSDTLAYAEVYNIMEVPEEYLNKTIKISGQYASSYYDQTDRTYHFVLVGDVTACCQAGLEFIWSGEQNGDYPAEQTNVEICGVFQSYEELGETYFYLDTDDIIILG